MTFNSFVKRLRWTLAAFFIAEGLVVLCYSAAVLIPRDHSLHPLLLPVIELWVGVGLFRDEKSAVPVASCFTLFVIFELLKYGLTQQPPMSPHDTEVGQCQFGLLAFAHAVVMLGVSALLKLETKSTPWPWSYLEKSQKTSPP
jgi:hypothetical protein